MPQWRGVALVVTLFAVAFFVISVSQRLHAETDLSINVASTSEEHQSQRRYFLPQPPHQTSSRDDSVRVRSVWVGERCMTRTELTNPKLVKECRESSLQAIPRVDPSACEAVFRWSEQKGARDGKVPPCGQYATGRFSPPFSLPSSIRSLPTTCREGVTSSIFKGAIPPSVLSSMSYSKLDSDTQLRELSINGCDDSGFFSYFTPEELVYVLRQASIGRNGQGILFSGDSMIRQMMLRIVSYIRGQKTFSEHYFHADGMYVLWRDRDELLVLDAATVAAHHGLIDKYFPGYRRGGPGAAKRKDSDGSHVDDDAVMLIMMFQWETQPSLFRKEIVHMPQVPLHVAAFMYWWDNKGQLSDIDEYMLAIERKHKSEKDSLAASYFFVTTPWTSPGLFGGVEVEKRLARNHKMVQWVDTKLSASNTHRHYGVVDYASLAEVEHMNKTLDGIHYMCIWLPKVPDLVRRQKYNYDRCRDHMNMAVVQWIAHAIGHTIENK